MTDRLDFERRFEARLRARAALADRPFDARSIARAAIVAGSTTGAHRPARRTIWLAVAAVLLLGGSLALALLAGSQRDDVEVLSGPPRNGWIAYSTRAHTATLGVLGEIFVVREGADPRHVAGDGNVSALCPAFSPDGRMLAYLHGADLVVLEGDPAHQLDEVKRFRLQGVTTFCAIWSPHSDALAVADANRLVVLPLDGSDPRVLGPEAVPIGVRTLAWAPDGATIAFASRDGIWLVPVDGSPWELLTTFEALSMVWAPDGGRVAAWGRTLTVFAVGTDRGVVLERPDGAKPDWSPVGGLAYDTIGGGLVVEGPDGREVVTASNGYGFAGWSPDGLELLSMRDVSGRDWNLVSLDVASRRTTIVQALIATGSSRNFPDLGDASWQAVYQ